MGRSSRGVVAAAAAFLFGCSSGGGGSGSPSGACQPGEVLERGLCIADCAGGGGSACGDACCAPGQTCAAPGQCVAAVVCGSGQPDCADGTACRGGVCVAADASCTWRPPEGEFKPRVAWEWTGSPVLPNLRHVLSTPIVVALQRNASDAIAAPAVVFASVDGNQGAGIAVTGVLRAVSGVDGAELWTSDPSHPVNGLAAVAAGDLDGDGFTELVAARLPERDAANSFIRSAEGLVAFGHDGRFLWELKLPTTSTTRGRVYWGAPSIANLYGSGEASIVLGATVIDARGRIVCEGTAGQGDNFLGPISAVADVDLDGVPEIVTGNTVYRNDCTPLPGWPNRLPNGSAAPDGLVAIADFTGDSHPEIVVVSGGRVRLQDWQGKVVWGPLELPPAGSGGGGAPTIADFDGDGAPEIGVAGNSRYTVFKPFAADPVLWSRPTQDASKVTGSSVFDFQHDGRAEVVYGDECYTRVFDGSTGTPVFEAQNPSCTVHENPVIADVDRDGRAEIVVGTNSVCSITCTAPDGSTWQHSGSGRHGVTVLKDLRDRWVSTRAVWNQHAYHVTNVGEDASIPVKESSHWLDPATNTFRLNPIGSQNFAAPDLAAEPRDVAVSTAACPASLTLTVKVWNRGAVLVAPGIPVSVYLGPAAGTPVAVAQTRAAIIPGQSELVQIAIPQASTAAQDLTIVLNDDGTGGGEGVVGECDRANNAVAVSGLRCPPASL